MDSRKEVQHVYLVGAKSLGAYGGLLKSVYIGFRILAFYLFQPLLLFLQDG